MTNVVNPTFTVFEPEAPTAVGAGVIICPGGGFHILAIDYEGYDVWHAGLRPRVSPALY